MLGAGNPKCKNCNKTAYAQESIVYDNQTYHKRCFRCTKCDNVVSLGKVAMIQGDLYCKNCFLRMFSEKGTYHVFGTKTLPKHMLAAAAKAGQDGGAESDAPSDATPEVASPTASENKDDKPKPRGLSAIKDSSAVSSSPRAKTCVIDECSKPRVVGRSWCEEHLAARSAQSQSTGAAIDSLFAAIRAKSVPDVQALMHKNGMSICLESVNRRSALAFAFSDEGSAACGEAMVEALADYLKDLEADVAMLKDQMAPENSEARSPTSSVSPAPAAAASPAPEPAPAAEAAPAEAPAAEAPAS